MYPLRRLSALKTLAPPPPPPPSAASAAAAAAFSGGGARRNSSDTRLPAFKETLIRMLRTYISGNRPPRTPPARFGSFWVEDKPGQMHFLLQRHLISGETVTVSASKLAASHRIDLNVEISNPEVPDLVLNFECSAWPEAVCVEKVYAVVRGRGAVKPYTGRDLRKLDGEVRDAVREYLEARGINDELAEYLHDYMRNKDRSELLRWLRNVESYVNK